MLVHGEYVLRAQAVQHVGRSNLDAMNQNATTAGGMGTTQVLQPAQITLGGQRVIAETVLRYALKKNSLSGAFGPIA